MIYLGIAIGFFVAAAATVLGGVRRFLRGRHVSLPLIRRLGFGRVVAIRYAITFGSSVPIAVHEPIGALVSTIGFAAWALDDLLFPEDREKKRRHEWAKIRLRMPKPIKLRPVEKWAPA